MSFTSIHTLRLDCALSHYHVIGLQGAKLTSLKRLIMNVKTGVFEDKYWREYGHQLSTVELSVRVTDLVQYMNGAMRTWIKVLQNCPNLEALHCHISNFPFELEEHTVTNTSLQEVMIHAGKEDVEASREAINRFSIKLTNLCEDRVYLPSLSKVKFHGSGWHDLLNGELVGKLEASAKRGNVDVSFLATEE